MISIANGLLQAALALLIAANGANVSAAVKQNAIQIANQAISYANQFLSQQGVKSSFVNKTSEAKKPNIKHLISQVLRFIDYHGLRAKTTGHRPRLCIRSSIFGRLAMIASPTIFRLFDEILSIVSSFVCQYG